MLETAQKYGISVSTLQRYLKNVPQNQNVSCRIHPIAITLQMDATYWGRNLGVVIFMDASSHRVLHYRFLCGKERISDYQAGVSYLQDQGFTIKAIVSDALSGIKEAFPEIPYQYCQFHQLQRIRHLLTTNPRLPAAKELKSLAHQLTRSSRLDFEKSLEKWEQKWKDFLQEKSYGEDGKWHFTHRRTRSAFYSLKRNLNALFTFENFPADQVPRTNNAIESLNSVLKMRLRLHRGLSKEKRELLIGNILGAYNPDKH